MVLDMLDNSYKISIIVPVYNIAQYLARCLDSIINQTYKNLEIIIVDDGSVDSSREIIEEYKKKDSRIISIFKENSGVSDTRNLGIESATGDYIGFVDGDDYIEPNMFEFLMDNAIKHNADISHCGYQMVFPSRTDYYYNTGEVIVQDNNKGVLDLLQGTIIEPGIWNKLYKRSVIGDVRMPSGIRINEDFLFNVMVFANAEKSVFEDKPMYHYILRKNSAATSSISEHKLFDGETVRERIVELFKDNGKIYPAAVNNLLGYEISLMRTFGTCKEAKPFLHRKKAVKDRIKKLYTQMKVMKKLSRRTQIECLLILYCPVLFNLVYRVYGRISGVNKKYEVK